MIGQAGIDGGTSQTGRESFNNFFVMQSSGTAAIIAEQSVVCFRFLARMNKHVELPVDTFRSIMKRETAYK